MSLTQITSHGIADGAIVNADLHSAAAIVLSKLNTTGTASSSTFLRGDGAWTAIDLSNLSASNLTSGTVPDARFPSTLPALDGSALTALNASNLASGTVGTARLGSGTASSSTFLRGDGSWQTMSADGGNAATLDSIDSSQFLRSDASDTATGQITFDGGSGVTAGPIITSSNTAGPKLSINSTASGGKHWMIISNGSGNTDGAGYLQLWNSTDSFSPVTFGATSGTATEFRTGIEINNNTVWNAGNDGSGSGLDADTLDGMEPAGLFSTGHTQTAQLQLRGHTNSWAGGIKFISNDGNNTAQLHMDNSTNYDLMVDSSFYVGGDIKIAGLSNIAWHAGNDGAGSGLDADLWDGNQFSTYLNQALLTTSHVTHAQIIATDWLRTSTAGEGLYNNATGCHFHSAGGNYWHINSASGNTTGALIFYSGYQGTHGSSTGRQGYVYFDTSGFGLLSNDGSWAYRHNNTYADIYGTLRRDASHTIWDSGNDGAGSGLDADLLDGYQQTDNATASTIVRRDGNGYIYAQHLWTTSGDRTTVKPTRFYASDDQYVRYYDGNYMRMWLGQSYKTTNYGRKDSTTDSNYWVGANGWGTTSMNTLMGRGNVFWDTWSNPSGQPSGTSHWNGFNCLHYTNRGSDGSSSGGAYGWQMTMGAGNPSLFYVRGNWSSGNLGTPTWYKVWNESNDGSGSGLDADTVDGLDSSQFIRSDAGDTASGDIIFTGWAAAVTIGGNSDLRFNTGNWTGESCKIQHHGNWLYIQGGSSGHVFRRSNGSDAWYIGSDGTLYPAGNGSYGIGTSGNRISTLYMGGILDSTTTIRTDDWYYNDTQGEGLYSSANGMHWYADHTQMMNAAGGTSANGIRFRDESGGTIRGYIYSTTSNIIGFLDYEGNWAFSSGKFTNYSHRDLCSQPDDGHDLGYGNRRWDNVYATNGTIQTSDRNEKENIVATDLGLDFVNKLSPVSFKRKGKTRTHYGFIAQDIEQIITDLGKTTTQFAPLIKSDISEAQDGSEYRYGLRYEQLLAPVVKAIQELAVKVAALESA